MKNYHIGEEAMHSLKENQLIKEAYAVTLDPSRLTQFEKFWEAYIDAQSQKGPQGFEFENTPVNAHITLALDILERLRFEDKNETLAQEMVNSHYGFGFIIDGEGKIIVSNSDAEEFTSQATNLRDLSLDQCSIEGIMRWTKVSAGLDTKGVSFFHVYIYDQYRTNCWFLAPINLNIENPGEDRKYFLITSVESKIAPDTQIAIGKSLGLTLAETQVAGLLSTGSTPKEITAIRNVKITAVRAQIVSIKSKMKVKDIPDIVRIFVSMGLRQRSVKAQISRVEHFHGNMRSYTREASMTLSDGRNFQFFEQGDPNGRIILQIHSLISGVEFPKEAGELLSGSGYRMISPARAGYGKSDQHPKWKIDEVINSGVEDIIEFLDHIGANNVIVLTGWAGAIAQRLALKDSERIKGIILSGAVPVWKYEYLNELGSRYRNMIKTSIHAPKAVPYLVRIAKALIDSGQSKFFIDGLDLNNMIDKKALRNSEVYRTLEKRFSFLVQQSTLAFAQDLPSIHTDWTEDARKIMQPVTLLMGDQNTDQPKEAQKRYMEVVPHANFVLIEGAGTYQNLTHFDDVLRTVDSMRSF